MGCLIVSVTSRTPRMTQTIFVAPIEQHHAKAEEGGGSLWDFAATALLLAEGGHVASDFYGEPLDLNRVDSTFMNHKGVLFATNDLLATQIQRL